MSPSPTTTACEIPNKAYIFFFLILIVAHVWLYQIIVAPRMLVVSVLDVGNGRAVLLQSPNDTSVLINTGPDASVLRAIGAALSPLQRNLSAVVLTDVATRAGGGFMDLAHRYHIQNFVRPKTLGSKSFEASLATALEKIPAQYVLPEHRTAQLTFDNVSVSFLPLAEPVVLKINYGATTLSISSSTPKGVYVSDGVVFRLK